VKEINIKHISNLHTDALISLDFYKQEILILTKRLEEIAADNTDHEKAEKVEYFQNQFLIRHNCKHLHLKQIHQGYLCPWMLAD